MCEKMEDIQKFLENFISFNNDGVPSFPEIRNLIDSIIPCFYGIKKDIVKELKEAEELQNFSQKVNYICDGCPIHNVAKIESDEGKPVRINVWESFMPFFWSLCYFVINSYDYGYLKKIQKGIFNGKIEFDCDELIRAKKIWLFGEKIRSGFQTWPKDAPNPNDGDEYTIKANGLFTYGMSFILYHEVGHLLKYHLGKKPCLEQEKEADNFAIECCLGANGKIQSTVKNGMVLALIALCLLDFYAGRDDSVHPNTDDRLMTALSAMHLADEDLTWMIAAFGLIIWFADFNFKVSFEAEYETPKAYFDCVIARFRENLDG